MLYCNCLRSFFSKSLNMFRMKKDAKAESPDDDSPHDIELKDAVELTLTGQTLQCRVTDIIDCNTIRILCYFYGVPVKVVCKFEGICCANKDSQIEEEKNRYTECILHLKNILTDQTFMIEFKGMDRFGKYMVNVFINDGNEKTINDILIEKNFAYEYKGGKKLTFDQWNLP